MKKEVGDDFINDWPNTDDFPVGCPDVFQLSISVGDRKDAGG